MRFANAGAIESACACVTSPLRFGHRAEIADTVWSRMHHAPFPPSRGIFFVHMPARPFRPCTHPGCGRLVNGRDARCDEHMSALRRELAQRQQQTGASETHSLYGAAWRKARAAFLREHPLCVGRHCKDCGYLTPATVVDHVQPHRGDRALFWERANWQPLCKPCHDSKTAREDGGFGNARRSRPVA